MDYDLRTYLTRNVPVVYAHEHIVESLYRPFTKKQLYFSKELNSRQYQLPRIFPLGLSGQNKAICFKGPTAEYFSVLATDHVPECKVAGTNNGRTFNASLSTATPPTASGSATSPSGACARSTTTTGKSGAPVLTSAIPTASAPRTSSPTPTPCSTTRCTATTTASTCSASSPACPSTTTLTTGPHGAGTAGPAPGL